MGVSLSSFTELPEHPCDVVPPFFGPGFGRLWRGNDRLVMLFGEAVQPADLRVRPLVRSAHPENHLGGHVEPGGKSCGSEHWGIVHPSSIRTRASTRCHSIGGMNVDPVPLDKSKLAYNLEEASAATGYSVSTLRIAIRRHDLVARYANTKPVLLAEELLDWLRSIPTEPKGGHQPLSYLDGDVEGWPGPPEEPQRMPKQPANALFRTPEEVAPELGISKSTLRSYCRTSGLHSRVGKRIMLHDDDVKQLVEWMRQRKEKRDDWWTEQERDPFL